jgi:hypothetical protein
MGVGSKSTPPYLSSKTNALQIFQINFFRKRFKHLERSKGRFKEAENSKKKLKHVEKSKKRSNIQKKVGKF